MLLQGSSFELCPLCNNNFPKAQLPFHINTCLDGTVGKRQTLPTPPQPIAQGLSEPSQPASEATSAPLRLDNPPAVNAFLHIMQKQREQSQTWSFFLGRKPDGAYHWHMWRDTVTSKGMASF